MTDAEARIPLVRSAKRSRDGGLRRDGGNGGAGGRVTVGILGNLYGNGGNGGRGGDGHNTNKTGVGGNGGAGGRGGILDNRGTNGAHGTGDTPSPTPLSPDDPAFAAAYRLTLAGSALRLSSDSAINSGGKLLREDRRDRVTPIPLDLNSAERVHTGG